LSEIRSIAERWGQYVLGHRWLNALLATNEKLLAGADGMLARGVVWWCAIAALFALQAALIFTHEPWVDEYQAVQIAVQAPDLATMQQWLGYEGHPPLWYWILRGLAYLMEPLLTLQVAAFGCALAAQSAILFGAPFSRAERLLIAGSQFFLFEAFTVSRSITLGIALMVIAIALWKRRASWLAIALLPMCDFLYGVISGMFVLMKWRDKALWWPGVALWIAVGLLAAWSVIPAPDVVPAIRPYGLVTDFGFYLSALSAMLVPFQGALYPAWNAPPWLPIATIGWLFFIWFAWRQTEPDRFFRFLLMGFLALTAVFALVVYRLSVRHLMLIAIMLILGAWLMRERGILLSQGFRLWLSVGAICGLSTAAINFVMPFDTARLAADKIFELGLKDRHWMVYPESRAQGVSAITGMEFEHVELNCMQSFVRWNHRSMIEDNDTAYRYFRQQIQRNGRSYLLSDLEFLDSPEMEYPPGVIEPIAMIPGGYFRQPFYLYVVGPDAPEKPVDLPPCVPGKRPFARL
jgi:hypothetical protein